MSVFDDPNDKLFAWEKLFVPVMNKYFPIKRKRIRKKSHPWIDKNILGLMRQRNLARTKSLKSKLASDYQYYKWLRNKVTNLLRQAKTVYFSHELDNHVGNPKAFWRLMRHVLPSNKKSADIEKNNCW